MALTKAYPTGDPAVPTSFYGVAVKLTPSQGQAHLLFEVQRAPDLAGAPDVGNAISLGRDIGPFPQSGGWFIDPRPDTSASTVWWYRARHVGPTGDDSAWSAWDGFNALLLQAATLANWLNHTNVYPLDPTMPVAGQKRSLSHLVSTPELVPNAEFDLWTADAQPYSWSVDTGDTSSAAKETTAVFCGDAALKYTFGGGGSAGTYRGVTTNDPVKGAFCLPLRPGRTYRVLVASRVSSVAAGTESYRLTLTFNVAATLTASKTFPYAAATTYQVDEWQLSIPAAAEANSKLAVEFTRGNTTTHDFWVDSLRMLEDAPSAATIAAQIAQAGGDFVQNGLFEQGTAYWRQTQGGSLDSTTTSPIEGLVSGQITLANSTTHRLQQCDRASDLSGSNPAGGAPIYVPVAPFDEIFGSFKFTRDANNSETMRLGVQEYDSTKTLIQYTYIASYALAGLGPITVNGGVVLSSTTRYVVVIFEVVTGGTSAGHVVKVDEVHLYHALAKRRCRVWRSTVQSIATATLTAIGFDTEDFDVGALHDNVTNNTRISIPADFPLVGALVLHGSVNFASNGTGYRRVRIRKNGTTYLASNTFQPIGTIDTGDDIACIVQCNGLVAGTDYFELVVDQTSGGNLNAQTGTDLTFFEAYQIF